MSSCPVTKSFDRHGTRCRLRSARQPSEPNGPDDNTSYTSITNFVMINLYRKTKIVYIDRCYSQDYCSIEGGEGKKIAFRTIQACLLLYMGTYDGKKGIDFNLFVSIYFVQLKLAQVPFYYRGKYTLFTQHYLREFFKTKKKKTLKRAS